MKKILNDLKLKFENPNWALDPEFALIDTVLEQHPELFEIVKGDINDWDGEPSKEMEERDRGGDFKCQNEFINRL